MNLTYLNESIRLNSTNATEHLTQKWTALPVVALITFILGLLANGSLLLLFIIDRTLRTPFNVYLINLTIANLSVVLLQYPMDVVSGLYAMTWTMGNKACTLYLYASYVLEAAVFNAHMLIALNRIWATLSPISYRSVHSIRTAISLCVLIWVYVHVVVATGWVLDALYYRLPIETDGCQLNAGAMFAWGVFQLFIVYNVPLVVMILAFPIMLISKISRRKLKRELKSTIGRNTVHAESIANSHPGETTVQLQQNGSKGHEAASLAAAAGQVTKTKPRSHGYLVLAFLTVSVTISWTPLTIYYSIQLFNPDFDLPIFYEVINAVFSLQAVLDPILFTLALKSVRDSFRRLIFLRQHN